MLLSGIVFMSSVSGVAAFAASSQRPLPAVKQATSQQEREAFRQLQEDHRNAVQQRNGNASPRNYAAPRQQPSRATQSPRSTSGTAPRELQNRLARREGENHETWYSRIDPTIMNIPGETYRAWKATLSNEDRNAYDAITRRRNQENRDLANQVLPGMIESMVEDAFTPEPNYYCLNYRNHPWCNIQ